MIVAGLKAFVFRKRDWRWLLVALALALVGHFLEHVPVISRLQTATHAVDRGLRQVQPFVIVDAYANRTRDIHGFWFCRSDREAFDATFNGTSERSSCSGPFGLVNTAVKTVIATPGVFLATWASGGWLARILLLVTLAAMAMFVVSLWRGDGRNAGADTNPFMGTIVVLALGPLLAAACYWLLLHLLLFLVVIFGGVLAGLVWCIATFAGVYKFCAFCLGVVKSSEDLKKGAAIIVDTPEEYPPS